MFALTLFASTALGGFSESSGERHIQCQIRGCSSALKTLKNWEICSLREVTERRCLKICRPDSRTVPVSWQPAADNVRPRVRLFESQIRAIPGILASGFVARS